MAPVLLFDKVALTGIAAGLVLYVLPVPLPGGLRLGFWLTLAATLLHVYTSSVAPAVRAQRDRTGRGDGAPPGAPEAPSLPASGGET